MQYSTNPFSGIPTVVKNLLIINGIVFLIKLTGLGNFGGQHMETWFGLHYFSSPLFKPWQLITHMFMHADGWHLVMNMLLLFMAGARLEYHWGSKRFLTYYLLVGVGAGLFYLIPEGVEVWRVTSSLDAREIGAVKAGFEESEFGFEYQRLGMSALNELYNHVMIGASGAVYGLILAFALLFPDLEIMLFPLFIPVKVKYMAFVLFGLAYYNSFVSNPGDLVAHLAHMGGMVIGYFLIRYWRRPNGHGFGGWGA
ncbi:MAG: rhomboid family intramembrane serine protease [Flavobacteriales bacterium]|nr:rhomboid family intramembrane serine protease [Flavobacteriales bacterium]